MSIFLRRITDAAGFRALKDDWNGVLGRSASNNVFLTWEWLYSWWEEYNAGKKLLIILAEENGTLVGIAPFYIANVAFFGILPLRHVEFIGSTGTCSEYLDFILQKGKEKELLALFVAELYRLPSWSWDVLNLMSMREDAANLRFLRECMAERGGECRMSHSSASPYIPLPGTMEDYVQTLGGKTRRKFRNYRHRLLREGTVSLRGVGTREELEPAFNRFLAIHGKRWGKRKNNGSFGENRVKYLSFHRNVVRRFFDRRWLDFSFLEVNGTPVAVQYNFIYAGKVYCHSVGFDPSWREKNVGSVLQYLALEKFIGMNISEFDFLRGTEEYKFYWTKTVRRSVDAVVWRSKARYALSCGEKALRSAARRLLPKDMALSLYAFLFCRKEDRQ